MIYNVVLKIIILATLSKALATTFKAAEVCSAKKCKLPNCLCSGLTLPLAEFEGHEKQIPQFITVTFDDAVNVINYVHYQQLFKGLKNPDNCEARGTFFVSHEYSDYALINSLYKQGHEIALHSITHGTGVEYWREANVERVQQEFGEQIDMLEKFAKINRTDIRGMRLPFLQLVGNNSFEAAKRLGLLYDSSWPTQLYRDPPMWPYTLDYRSVQDCQIKPCPKAAFRSLWINPMVTWIDTKGYSCAMIDACPFQPKDEINSMFDWMLSNFKRHYKGNRAPFGMYLHAAWFERGLNRFEALRKFLEYVTTLPDVYITTASQVIEYMKQPKLGKPFESCAKKPQTKCMKRTCALKKMETGEMRYMSVCDKCPEVYPWLNNPYGLEEES